MGEEARKPHSVRNETAEVSTVRSGSMPVQAPREGMQRGAQRPLAKIAVLPAHLAIIGTGQNHQRQTVHTDLR